jgi:hypothetical protein
MIGASALRRTSVARGEADGETCDVGRLQRLDEKVLAPQGRSRMSARAGAWMSLCVGLLGLAGAAIDVVAVATGGDKGTDLLMLIVAASLGATFTGRGVRQLRQPD